ncbi:MAG: PIN domain-containing protein [Spirochaetes bacterium]|jgi:predicted nucleic acid-binding protein|nr:PIN domain-containing protein [Spirochaetota bacterium]
MMKLVDTSVWIRHFSSADPFDLRSFCAVEWRVICLPIYQEILQGIRDETAFRRIREALDAATMIESPLPRDRYFEAGQLFRAARRQGLTVRSSVDCLIAACAIHHNLIVLHSDRDFPALAKVSVLKQEAG